MRVATNPHPKASTMVAPDEPLHLEAPASAFVSRAGQKLDGALDAFAITVSGRRAIDVGASTGGFTDCLLQRGATSVTALDVGYGQLHHRIRSDPRVTTVERTNIRHADVAELGAPFAVVVADLSFISLLTVASALASLGDEDSDWILLIKPQFEAGRNAIGRGGVVRDPQTWQRVLFDVTAGLADVGLACHALEVSSIRGTEGNVEFVGHFRREPATMSTSLVAELVESIT